MTEGSLTTSPLKTAVDISPEAVAQQDAHLVHNGHQHGADMLTALRTELTASEKPEWRPIDTCPKDQRVLVAYDYHGDLTITVATNHATYGFIWPSKWHIPTHWMPLPENPT